MTAAGVDLVRTWGFLNGQDDPYLAYPIQPKVRKTINSTRHLRTDVCAGG